MISHPAFFIFSMSNLPFPLLSNPVNFSKHMNMTLGYFARKYFNLMLKYNSRARIDTEPCSSYSRPAKINCLKVDFYTDRSHNIRKTALSASKLV